MPKGVYTRKPRSQALTVVPKRRSKKNAQAYQMLRAASAQLHALAINIEIASQILGMQDEEETKHE